MKELNKIYYLISKKFFFKACILILMFVVMAFLDLMGIAAIFPFISLLSDPSLVETNFYFNYLYKLSSIFNITSIDSFIYFFSFIFFFTLVVSILFKAFTSYMTIRFLHMCEYDLSKRLTENYLRQPYSWFLNKNSSNLGKTILSEVGLFIGGYANPIIDLFSQFILLIFIFALLIYANPIITITIILTLGIAYSLIFFLNKINLDKFAKARFDSNSLRFFSLNEVFTAIKEVKLGGSENIYLEKFTNPSKLYAKSNAYLGILSQIPKFALEILAFGGAILIILVLMSNKKDFNNMLPIISLYVFSGYRIMPILQKVYNNVLNLKFYTPTFHSLYNDLKLTNNNSLNEDKNKIIFNQKIVLINISYNYPKSEKIVLTNINFDIPLNHSIGIAGSTGSGKTTLVDIILGLLDIQEGEIKIDDSQLDEKNKRSWQNCIGYVPQQVYLSDNNIAENIAFGSKSLNLDQVHKVAKIACIDDFIINELPNKYQTSIGERGIRLSGGQRQRIGIARALYNNPKFLVLDEATSALDNITEANIMKALKNYNKNITSIIIAHRLNTLKNCDKIILLEKGKLVAQGSYAELKNNNNIFKEMSKFD
jgi:ATP-binding cassette, subfamily B, bacterial PglK